MCDALKVTRKINNHKRNHTHKEHGQPDKRQGDDQWIVFPDTLDKVDADDDKRAKRDKRKHPAENFKRQDKAHTLKCNQGVKGVRGDPLFSDFKVQMGTC